MNNNFEVTGYPYSINKFSAGEINVRLNFVGASRYPSKPIEIRGNITSSDNLVELLMVVDAIRNVTRVALINLVMPYCAYSRQDRVCNPGEALSIKVFANIINSCNFNKVVMWDNHSDVATALINNGVSIPVSSILSNLKTRGEAGHSENSMKMDYDFIISPDAGANKKVQECSKVLGIPMLRADKTRDTQTGKITGTVIYTEDREDFAGKKMLIIDDICDGGYTFKLLADTIKEREPDISIDLYITHALLPKGAKMILDAGIDNIFTSNNLLGNEEVIVCK